MLFLFEYIIKLSVSLVVVYLFYQLILRKLTFYNWNRWYLAGYTFLSFVIAFIDITPSLQKNAWMDAEMVKLIPAITIHTRGEAVWPRTVHGWDRWDWSLLLLLAGILVLSVRLLLLYISYRRVRNNATLLSGGEMNIYQVNKDIIPFTFGNSIFINPALHDEAELQKIIRHEFVHVKQKHTHDIIWGEILCVINWYNPFAWLIRRAIRQNLEFIADNKVLEAGLDRKQYQYLLLKVIGNHHFSIANQFNFSSLKKRIAMMNKMKSARAHLIKFLFIVPLVVVLLLAFRNKDTAKQQQQVPAEYKELKNILLPADTVPPAPINRKGYYIDVIGNGGNCVIVVKDRNRKEVERLTMKEWNDRSSYYEGLYGEVPPPPPAPPAPGEMPEAPEPPSPVAPLPPPPPPPPADLKDKNVESIVINNNDITVTLKNGKTEKYNSDNKKEKAAFEKKYGKMTEPPVPPVPPKITTSIRDVSITAPVAISTTPVVATTATIAPITTTVDIVPTVEITPVKTVTIKPIRAVVATTTKSDVQVALTQEVTINKLPGEKIWEQKIYKNTSRESLSRFIADARSQGVELVFNDITYNAQNELTLLTGFMQKDNSKNTFTATDFEVIKLIIMKSNGKYSLQVNIQDQKERI